MKLSRCHSSFIFSLVALKVAFFTASVAFGQEQKLSVGQEAQKFFEMANKQVQNKDFSGAIVNYQNSIKSNPLLSTVHYNLANVYVQIGEVEKGIAEYQKAIKIDPMVSDYHRNLGYAYALLRKGDLAKQKYEDLKKLDPAKADVLMQWIQGGQK